VKIKVMPPWLFIQWSFVDGYQYCGGICWLHLLSDSKDTGGRPFRTDLHGFTAQKAIILTHRFSLKLSHCIMLYVQDIVFSDYA
jgi:hypothetical protein